MKFPLFYKSLGWRTNLLLLTAALITGGIITYCILRFRTAESISPPAQAAKTNVQAVGAIGYLEPLGEVIHLSAPSFTEGSRVDQLLVKRGDSVKVGQIIAILDSRDRLNAALKQAQTEVTVARARLAQVKAGAKTGDIQAQSSKFQGTQAELAGQLTTQKAAIANLEAQLQGEKSAQSATIARIKAELSNAQTDCKRYETLYQEGVVSAIERDDFCLKKETTSKSLLEAQANLARIISTLPEQINEAKANLNRTIATQEKEIQENQATLNSVSEVRGVDVQVAQAELASAESAVQKAKADLDLAYVRSPINGQILKIHTLPGEVIKDEGIVDVGQTQHMYVRAEVYETDIHRVRIGQSATLKSDGVIGDLKGIVEEIGLQIDKKDVLGTDPVADADARVVEVKIRLTPEDSSRVAGLTNLQVNVIITQ